MCQHRICSLHSSAAAARNSSARFQFSRLYAVCQVISQVLSNDIFFILSFFHPEQTAGQERAAGHTSGYSKAAMRSLLVAFPLRISSRAGLCPLTTFHLPAMMRFVLLIFCMPAESQ